MSFEVIRRSPRAKYYLSFLILLFTATYVQVKVVRMQQAFDGFFANYMRGASLD